MKLTNEGKKLLEKSVKDFLLKKCKICSPHALERMKRKLKGVSVPEHICDGLAEWSIVD